MASIVPDAPGIGVPLVWTLDVFGQVREAAPGIGVPLRIVFETLEAEISG
jgi:hypothetical protein